MKSILNLGFFLTTFLLVSCGFYSKVSKDYKIGPAVEIKINNYSNNTDTLIIKDEKSIEKILDIIKNGRESWGVFSIRQTISIKSNEGEMIYIHRNKRLFLINKKTYALSKGQSKKLDKILNFSNYKY